MDRPPICNYEGSDYQVSFWDRGGRAYEDAAEAVALRRLLPAGSGRLLELGAGAGRNTPRYHGFEQIVLLDYSLTQLQQARQRLGDTGPEGACLRYVAADVYRLPFLAGLFDAATMIRTLHHLVDPSLALGQVRQALRPGAPFILEYANKQNLKAIFRYALRRQAWSPFSLEPVEFAPLNFDFHPAAVRAWLRGAGFAVERQLTVSHFRIGLFKRVLPLGLLVKLDSLAQLTGSLWQLFPQRFCARQRCQRIAQRCQRIAQRCQRIAQRCQRIAQRCQRIAQRCQRSIRACPGPAAGDGFFRCPACQQAPLPDTPPELACPACGERYPVIDGIYDLRAAQAETPGV